MGCVHSSDIIKLNDNHEEKTDNNQRNNISNSINNSCIKDKYKKSPKEEMMVTKKNSNKIIQNKYQKNENEINENEYKKNENEINENEYQKNENEINQNEEIEKEESKKDNNNDNIEFKAEIIQAPSEENSIIKQHINLLNVKNSEIINKYDILEETSRNQMAINYKIKIKNRKKTFKNLKLIRKCDINNKSSEKKILSEIEILKNLNHENIIKVEECIVDQNNYYIIGEYCQYGTLEEYINKIKKFTETQTKYIISQLLKAIYYLNSKNFVHTDIKPENILIEKIMKKRDEELCDIKLLDFGSSSSLKNEPSNDIPIINLPYYVSPEIIDRKYNAKCDIWSIGVIMYEMLFGKKLFTGNNYNEVINCIKTKKIEFEINNINNSDLSDDSIYLLKNMIIRQIESRFDAKRCLEHPWFVSLKEFDDLDEDINTDSNKKNSDDIEYKNSNFKGKNNSQSLNSSIHGDNNIILVNNNNCENKDNYPEGKIKLKTLVNKKINYENTLSERSNRTFNLRNNELNKEKEKNIEFINLTIKYLHHFYRKEFEMKNEEENLKKIFDKNKINEKINLKEIIFCFNKYSGYDNNIITCISSNEMIENNFKKKFPNENSLDFENFKNFLLSEKEKDIINKLKIKYEEIEKTKREDIKNCFNEIKKKPDIQRYFDGMIKEMDEDKLKEIYLFIDYLKLIEKTVIKLNSKEEIEKFKEEKKRAIEEEEKRKKLEEEQKKREKQKEIEEERKREIEEEYKRKQLEEEERRKHDEEIRKKIEENKKKEKEGEKKKSSKSFDNNQKTIISNKDKRFSYITPNYKNGINGELNKNPNAFNEEEFLKLIEK